MQHTMRMMTTIRTIATTRHAPMIPHIAASDSPVGKRRVPASDGAPVVVPVVGGGAAKITRNEARCYFLEKWS